MKFPMILGAACTLSLLSACSSSISSPYSDPAYAGLPERVTEAQLALRSKAEILSMPKVQTGWIMPSPATDSVHVGIAPLPPVSTGPIGGDQSFPEPPVDTWDYDAVREWRVRLSNGKQYTIYQALPRLSVGQEVLIVRYADRLAITP